jgi:hypothetical protein
MTSSAADIDATYETISAACSHCGERSVYNRVSDLGTTQAIDSLEVTCQHEGCRKAFHVTGDLINPAYEMLLYECHSFLGRKRYMQCVLGVSQAYEVFFNHFMYVHFLYRPVARDSDPMRRFPLVSDALFKRLKRFTFDDLRKTFLAVVAEGIRPTSLAHAEQLVAALSDRPAVPTNAIEAVVDADMKALLIGVRDTAVNRLRNRVVHKEAYRPTFEEASGVFEEACTLVGRLGAKLRLRGDANWYINGLDR